MHTRVCVNVSVCERLCECVCVSDRCGENVFADILAVWLNVYQADMIVLARLHQSASRYKWALISHPPFPSPSVGCSELYHHPPPHPHTHILPCNHPGIHFTPWRTGKGDGERDGERDGEVKRAMNGSGWDMWHSHVNSFIVNVTFILLPILLCVCGLGSAHSGL